MTTPSVTQTPSTTSPNQTDTAPKKKYKIMVVDDEVDARELFAELLATVPEYEVSSAVDGIDALAKAEAEEFDLILLDIVMPRQDGVESLLQIKENPEKYGDPVVIMLTNIGGDVAVQKAKEQGAVGYLLKINTEPQDLLEMVKEELKKKETGTSTNDDFNSNVNRDYKTE